MRSEACYCLTSMERWALPLVFAGVGGGMATGFCSVVFGCSSLVTAWKFPVVLGCPFPCLLTGQIRLLSVLIFVFWLLVFPDCCILRFQARKRSVQGGVRGKENPTNSPSCFPLGPKFSD